MDNTTIQLVASQLRKPDGEMGVKVGEMMNKGNLHINMNTLERISPAKGDTILEIGMGNGEFVKEILSVDTSIRYVGCDYSSTMIDEATLRNADYVAAGRAQFILCSADSLPFEDGAFDKVFTINTVYFWSDPTKELAEIARVLKQGGEFTISIRSKSSMQTVPFTQYGFTLYSQEELETLLKANGYSITKSEVVLEPAFEMNGEMIQVDSVIVTATV